MVIEGREGADFMSIQPQTETIQSIFNREYYIDFYQREYKWKKSQVRALLEDIFHRFDLLYNPQKDATPENINKYDWYYLSSFITNDYNGRCYIVDGQQRLTTLTLILIKLIHLAKKYNTVNLKRVLEDKVYGNSIQGQIYWMGQNGRTEVLNKLYSGEQIDLVKYSTPTLINLVGNYTLIDEYLSNKLETEHKFHCFVLYLLTKVQLVKIHIDESKDVPMVFEVINDRGEKLKPYEVFKGEILGQLDKDDIDKKYGRL